MSKLPVHREPCFGRTCVLAGCGCWCHLGPLTTANLEPAEVPQELLLAMAQAAQPRAEGEPRTLITMHYPLPMGMVAELLRVVARYYPAAVVAEDGQVLERRRG